MVSSTVWQAERVVAAATRLGEGPWWDAACERLLWVDIEAGRIHSHTPRTGDATSVDVGADVGFLVGADGGGFVAGTARGIVALDAALRTVGTLAAPPDLDGRRINDGACDSAGRVLFGTVDPTGRRPGTLWSLDAEGDLAALAGDVGMSNGLGFSPAGDTLYYVDSRTGRLDRFAYDPATGEAADRTPLFRVPEAAGLPDGLAVDAQGCVWLAVWGAGEVWRLTPEGEACGTIRVPAAETSSCAFAGERLYVTTAHDGVFAADVGVRGAPVWTA